MDPCGHALCCSGLAERVAGFPARESETDRLGQSSCGDSHFDSDRQIDSS